MENAQKVNGFLFAKMVQAGTANLRAHAQAVNNLNVFPIPDGDTGSNMLLTIMGGADAVGRGTEDLSETARRVSDGMLLSARGNSGVILSQIFEGVADGFENIEEADNQAWIKALQKGVEHSYNAVMDPTEGTILTVMRCATEYVSSKAAPDVETMLQDFLKAAKKTLEKTPDMLPVLKKAGVVDSGAAGLICIVEGMFSALDGDTNYDYTQLNALPSSGSASELDLDALNEDSV